MARLAPEVRIGRAIWDGRKYAANPVEPSDSGIDPAYIYTDQMVAMAHCIYVKGTCYCCEYTFMNDFDRRIPPIERALSLYLYHKLFPERFHARENQSQWDFGYHQDLKFEVEK